MITFTAMALLLESDEISQKSIPASYSRLLPRDARDELDCLFRECLPAVIEPPRAHFARLRFFHLKNDVAVPRPGMFAVIFARSSRRIRMRMVPANQVPALCHGLFLRAKHVLRLDRKPIVWRIVSPVFQRQYSQYIPISPCFMTEKRAATFMRVISRAMLVDFFDQHLPQLKHSALTPRPKTARSDNDYPNPGIS